jgi:protein-tyrosine phosphatase
VGITYLKSFVMRTLRVRHRLPGSMLRDVHTVLFVCNGNIIRSPMAAALFRQYSPPQNRQAISVLSAGLQANPTRGADDRALTVAKEYGISLDDHHAQPVTPGLIAHADLIVVMDYRNEAELLARNPEAKSKIFLLGEWGAKEHAQQTEIPDPYSGDTSDIRRCYAILQSCTRKLASDIAKLD